VAIPDFDVEGDRFTVDGGNNTHFDALYDFETLTLCVLVLLFDAYLAFGGVIRRVVNQELCKRDNNEDDEESIRPWYWKRASSGRHDDWVACFRPTNFQGTDRTIEDKPKGPGRAQKEPIKVPRVAKDV